MRRFVKIVSARFCAMCYVIYGIYLPRDEEPEGEKLQKERNNSVKLYQTESSPVPYRPRQTRY